MNGVHDMGGQHGHGRVSVERDEAVFHEAWEGRVYALMRLARRSQVFNLDEMRRAIESIPPPEYLSDSYYERWLTALEALLVEKGVAGPAARRFTFPDRPDKARARDSKIADRPDDRRLKPSRAAAAPPRFAPGDRVKARNVNPHHHTRLPRYVRDHEGVVESVRADHVLPDVSAHIGARGEPPPFEHVYTVIFEAREIWGDDGGSKDRVTVDLWESYLEPSGD